MKAQATTQRIRLTCERCRGLFYLKLPGIKGVMTLGKPHPFRREGAGITLCLECQREFDESALEE